MKQALLLILASFIGAFIALSLERLVTTSSSTEGIEGKQNQLFGSFSKTDSSYNVPAGINFIQAAKISKPTVVSIQSTSSNVEQSKSPFDEFFGNPYQEDNFSAPKESSGSGVILTADGYIVTNNHVVDNASEVKIILDDKRSFMAKVIGVDETTDLALLKIDANNLPFARYGNSDNLAVGEWVLALGNPYDLTQTVTAGIVSAKARNINILRSKSNMQIESFIQTDAAVNPGNSGGALVNLRGELIGINTAIASQTGSYSGYSFAVPVSIVKKVMDDLLKFGSVQRAVLGVEVRDINAEFAKEHSLPDTKGVYVNGVFARSGAADAKLMAGDVIYQINGVEINSAAEMVELVARNRPGDKIKLKYGRNGKVREIEVRLKARSTDSKLADANDGNFNSRILGAELRTLTEEELRSNSVTNGVKVLKMTPQSILAEAGVREGFLITSLDKKPITSPEQLERIIAATKGGALIEGQYPNGKKAYYALAPTND